MPLQEMLFGVPPPEPAALTKPGTVSYDPELSSAKQLTMEDVSAHGFV